jgi:F-type H+-transporting ATPase subunit a
MAAPSPTFYRLLRPIGWLLAATAAVYGSEKKLLWPEILAGWGLVLLNAGLAWGVDLLGRRGPPSRRAMLALAAQTGRGLLLASLIYLVFRLDFLKTAAFLSASFAGYLLWLAGHVFSLHRNSSAAEMARRVQDYIMHHVADMDYWAIGGIKIPLPFGLSLHMAMTLAVAIFLLFLFVLRYRKGPGAPRGLTNALESMILFVRDEIAVPYLGPEDGRRMCWMFLNFFFFILAFNLCGLIPIFPSVTGNFSATAALAVVTFLFMTLGAMVKNGPVGFFQAFVPHGLPTPILFLVVPLEILGVFIKAFVLALRLFANLLAGHIALFSILGLAVSVSLFMAPVSLGLGLFVFLLEILIAFLQAYIFTMLSAMFIGQIYHPEH